MPRNGSGSYSLPQPPFVPNTTISSSSMNSDLNDVAAALTQSLAADGQTPLTGPLQGSGTGTPGQPSFTFTGSVTSGLYPAGGGTIGVSVNGSNVATFTPSGLQAATTPIGMVVDFAGSAAPAQWLLCFGQAISRTTYAALFAAIGTTYGVGDGSTTFNLPDCRGRATFGQDNMGGVAAGRITAGGGNYNGTILGSAGGSQNHTLNIGEIPSHNHGVNDPSHSHSLTPGNVVGTASASAVLFQGSGTPVGVPAGLVNASTGNSQTGISIANNGGGAAHTILNPSIIFNKIIYAGV